MNLDILFMINTNNLNLDENELFEGNEKVVISQSFRSKVVKDGDSNYTVKKIISVNNVCESDKSTLRDTAEKLIQYDHVNLRKIIDFEEIECKGINLFAIKQEYIKNSFSNYKFENSSNVNCLPYDKLIYIIKQILESLAYLSEKSSFHGNLNPNNIFIDENLKVKISDYQINRNTFSKIFEQNEEAVEYNEEYFECENSHLYLSPEVILGADQDISSDMWALGTIILNFLLNKTVFKGYSKINVLHSIFNILGSPKETSLCTLPYYNSIFSTMFEKKNKKESIEDLLIQNGIFLNCSFIDFIVSLLSYEKNDRIDPNEALKSNLFN